MRNVFIIFVNSNFSVFELLMFLFVRVSYFFEMIFIDGSVTLHESVFVL